MWSIISHFNYFERRPLFYKDILLYFQELKTPYRGKVGDTYIHNFIYLRILQIAQVLMLKLLCNSET